MTNSSANCSCKKLLTEPHSSAGWHQASLPCIRRAWVEAQTELLHPRPPSICPRFVLAPDTMQRSCHPRPSSAAGANRLRGQTPRLFRCAQKSTTDCSRPNGVRSCVLGLQCSQNCPPPPRPPPPHTSQSLRLRCAASTSSHNLAVDFAVDCLQRKTWASAEALVDQVHRSRQKKRCTSHHPKLAGAPGPEMHRGSFTRDTVLNTLGTPSFAACAPPSTSIPLCCLDMVREGACADHMLVTYILAPARRLSHQLLPS